MTFRLEPTAPIMPGLPARIARSVVFSPGHTHRYVLGRDWQAALPWVLWVMLNPSRADVHDDDATTRKCMGFAHRWGCGGIRIVNLYAFIATQPAALHDAHARGLDVVGPENATAIVSELHAARLRGAIIVAAWGAHAFGDAPRDVEALLVEHGAVCLGRTDHGRGEPRHPLMLAYETPREPLTVRT